MSLADLRSGPRLSTSLPVALYFPDADPPEGWGRILDISVTGARIETRWPLKVGQSLYLTFQTNSEMKLENLRAQVVRAAWEEGYFEGGLVFDASVDQTYLKEALLVLMGR